MAEPRRVMHVLTDGGLTNYAAKHGVDLHVTNEKGICPVCGPDRPPDVTDLGTRKLPDGTSIPMTTGVSFAEPSKKVSTSTDWP